MRTKNKYMRAKKTKLRSKKTAKTPNYSVIAEERGNREYVGIFGQYFNNVRHEKK